MTSDEAAPDSGDGKSGPLPFDTSVAHQARMYDYMLGGYFLYAQTTRAGRSRLPAT